MDLARFAVAFDSEAEYGNYLERLRWPRGINCIYCTYSRVATMSGKAGEDKAKAKGPGRADSVSCRRIFQCGNRTCRRQFSVTSGTIFHKTHVPLSKWFRAITLIRNSPVTARALQRELQVSYQTAWYLKHRIQEALRSGEHFLPAVVDLEED